MLIYDDEQSLSEQITSNTVCRAIVNVSIVENKEEALIKSLEAIKANKDERFYTALSKIVENPHPDLMYGSAILVSTVINKNDDVFLPNETWEARDTAINQPFNDEHIKTEIIGHIIASKVLDKDGKEVTGTEAPDYFDIAVDFVVYKSIFPSIAQEIADKAPKGEKFVSMECTFADFDYALFTDEDTSTAKIVKRNKATAFLTKYLRIYGGTGRYQNYKVGRVIRNFRFSGMGNVDKPANPDSEYTRIENIDEMNDFEKTKAFYFTKGQIMKVENMEQAEKVIADLSKEVETLKASVEELTNTTKKLNEDLTNANTKVEVATSELKKAQDQSTELNKVIEATKAELQTKSDILNKIESEKKLVARVEEMTKLGVTVDDAKKTMFSTMTDESFASLVKFTSDIVKPKTPEQNAQATVEAAKPDATPAVENTAGDDNDASKKIQSAAAKLVEAVRGRKGKKENK